MSFRSRTGMLDVTETGQKVTPANINELPCGSVVRNGDGSRIIHLHDRVWLYCCDGAHCYDTVDRIQMYLDKTSEICHIP